MSESLKTTSTPPILDLLHQSSEFVVVQKPSGVAVHRGWAPEKDVVMRRLRNQLDQWVWPIHRLDKGTSGALLFALNRRMARLLNELFQKRKVHKSYLALVRGIPEPEGLIDYAIPRSNGQERVPASTRYRILCSAEGYSLIQAWPKEGRFHQIRRHFKHIRHPIIGDTNYGDGKRNRFCRSEFGLYRLALHALELGFCDPTSEARINVVAPIPSDLGEPLLALGLSMDDISRKIHENVKYGELELGSPEPVL